MEYVAEKNSGHPNADYFYTEMTGGAWDANGNFHGDPGEGTDPYVHVQQTDSNGDVSLAEWSGGHAVNSPDDPMIFEYLEP